MNDRLRNNIWAVITTVLAIIFSYVAFTIWDRIEANSEGKTNTSTSVNLELVEPSIKLVTMPNMIDPKTWGRQMAQDFREDKIRDSAGRGIPRKIVRRLSNYAVTKAEQGIKVRRWWTTGGMNQAHCMANWGWTGGTGWCMRYGNHPTVVKINREITKITVICSGAAVIGSIKGGGWVGAGRGGLGCVWTRWATKASQ